MLGHAVVRALVVGGHGTFVAEEGVNLFPVGGVPVLRSEQLVESLWGRATGERHGEAPLLLYALRGLLHKGLSGGPSELPRAFKDAGGRSAQSSSISTALLKADT